MKHVRDNRQRIKDLNTIGYFRQWIRTHIVRLGKYLESSFKFFNYGNLRFDILIYRRIKNRHLRKLGGNTAKMFRF